MTVHTTREMIDAISAVIGPDRLRAEMSARRTPTNTVIVRAATSVIEELYAETVTGRTPETDERKKS